MNGTAVDCKFYRRRDRSILFQMAGRILVDFIKM